MIYGKPIKIKAEKADFYIAYMHQELEPKTAENQLDSMQNIHEGEETPGQTEVMDDETFFMVERVVQEYNTIKQVLINNAIPVDVSHIASGGKHKGQSKNTKGWGMRVLFDKKVFNDLLIELEYMRKLIQVKKMQYLFNAKYEGKSRINDNSKMSIWRRKVEARTTRTLKFVNMSRMLRIIHYDPSQYMSLNKLNQMISISGAGEGKGLDAGLGQSSSMVAALSGESYRNSLVEQTRKQNIGSNLW